MRATYTIDPDRLVHLPKVHWHAHEFSFYVHDQMVELLVQYETSGAHTWVENAFRNALVEAKQVGVEVDMLKFLKEHGLVQFYKHHIVGHLVLGLTSDMLHFLYEALRCFEKRKFSVGYALLRKPLKENLLFLSWILGDQDDFIGRFEQNTSATLNRVTPEKRLSIMKAAAAKLTTHEAFDAEILNEMIFSKTCEAGFEPLWQRASHLVTSQGALLKTEDLNINFVFYDARDNQLFGPLYKNLPYLMLYAVQVVLECFACILRYNERTVSHLIISTMGCYEALIGGKSDMARMLKKTLSSFLKCSHCEAKLRLTRANAVDMYLREQLTCHACGITSPFPLYWLLCAGKINITREGGAVPIMEGNGAGEQSE